MAAFVFDPRQVAPAQPREARAPGWYAAKGVTDSDVKVTAAGGTMLTLTVELQDGGFVWSNFNIGNANPEVASRAMSDVAALCAAVGLLQQVNDTREFHGRPFDVKLKIEKSEGYDDKNVIATGGFAPLGSRADKYVRAAEPPRGAAFQPGSGHGAQFSGAQAPAQPQQFQQPTQFTPPAPIQQQMPQSPTQFQQAPQPVAQAPAQPQQFQPATAPAWTQR